MRTVIDWFVQILNISLQLFFKQEKEDGTISDVYASLNSAIQASAQHSDWLQSILPENRQLTFEEQLVLALALIPHISPQTLDILFIQNKDLDRPYTEFGGWKGISHGGFLPTGQTAAFLLSQIIYEKLETRNRITKKIFLTSHFSLLIFLLLPPRSYFLICSARNIGFIKKTFCVLKVRATASRFLAAGLLYLKRCWHGYRGRSMSRSIIRAFRLNVSLRRWSGTTLCCLITCAKNWMISFAG